MDFYHTIYLSPHLDDVALSCGGQIYTQTAVWATAVSQPILIVTLTAGDPPTHITSAFTQELHQRWDTPTNPVARRRAEDQTACHILQTHYQHWDILDCVYRQHPETGELLYTSREHIFGEIHPAERQTVLKHLIEKTADLPTCHTLCLPLTIGHHVDHQLTRLAAEQSGHSNIWYYEDYPYARTPGALEAVLTPSPAHWQAKILPLSEAALQAKMEAIKAFASQISTFFTSEADLEQQIRQYAAQVGGERIWQKTG